MAKTRASAGLMVTPRVTPNESEERRKKWLADAAAGFVNPSAASRLYYSVILEALWPAGHGVPGPILTENDVRAAVDAFRAAKGYDYRCAHCGRQEPDVKLSPDHKIPRVRHGSNEFGNYQPLVQAVQYREKQRVQRVHLDVRSMFLGFP